MKIRKITTDISAGKYFEEEQLEFNNVMSDWESGIVNIFPQARYQEILGFGGAFTESAAYNYSLLSQDDKKRFMELYFSKDKGIGYSFGRTHINSCDFSLDIYSYVSDGDKTLGSFDISRDKKYIIPFIKDALKYCEEELILFASPWSPPGYMKNTGKAPCGGKLLDEYKELWAHYYAKYIKAFAAEGIKISAITVQNEPMAWQPWESCEFSAEDEKQFLGKYLVPALDAEGLTDIKIIIWDHNKERVFDRAEHILKDSDLLRKRVWAVGHHWYSGDHFDGMRLVHEQLDKPLICTEICLSLESDPLFVAEKYAHEISGNFNNFEIASCDWNLILNDKGGPFHNRTGRSSAIPGAILDDPEGGLNAAIVRNSETNEMTTTPIYYYIGHFSKFVKRGARRIGYSKHSDDIEVCPFVNPDGTIVCIIVNASDKEQDAIIRIDGTVTKNSLRPHTIQTVIIER